MALVTVLRSPSSNSSPIHDGSLGFHDKNDANVYPKSLSECYFAGKGTALVLPDASAKSSPASATEASPAPGHGPAGGRDARSSPSIQKHLQSMFYLLGPEETLKMAVKLESVHPTRTRYLVVVSRMGVRGEECCLLGIDCNDRTTVGLVLRVLANTRITLDGDGGFSVGVCERHHIFKPVSVQAMWSALQTLHKVSAKAREQNYFQGGVTHSWAEYYESRIESDRSCLNEWHAMDDLESKRPPSPDSVRTKPTEREETETVIRSTLKEIMMSVDLDEVTSKTIRSKLEEELDMDLGEYKSFIDQEMLVILGQMDAPTEIFDHVYLGSEWNASNYDELKKNGVGHILNVTREIDNFFPGTFDYHNVRVYDDEKTDLLKYWDTTFKFITKANEMGSKVLVHCKMGVSRSASVVIAYAMKAYNWDFETALKHVKEKRPCIKPNISFLLQLLTYQGILGANKNRDKLQRSKSETNLKSPETDTEKTEKAVISPPAPKIDNGDDPKSTMSGQDLRHFGVRPKSWSPDNLKTRELAAVVKSSPLSASLEDFNQTVEPPSKQTEKQAVKEPSKSQSLARHVLMPCDNGESYSVSPNQIVHLPGHDTGCGQEGKRRKLVLNLATKFEKAEEVKEETWDPGEGEARTASSREAENNIKSDTCDSKDINVTVWTSSLTIKNEDAVSFSDSVVKVPEAVRSRIACDPFSNQLDRVFDREEKRQNRTANSSSCPPELTNRRESPSRQSSWSSYDSAVALSCPTSASELSRHGSWGSGDARAPPSRNSSWGSYDARPRSLARYVDDGRGEQVARSTSDVGEDSSSGVSAYGREDVPWRPGTVRRSKQKIEENTNKKTPSSETIQFDLVHEAINVVLVGTSEESVSSSAISDKIDIPGEEPTESGASRLSISAPEPSSMELVSRRGSLSRSASNVSTADKDRAPCSSVKQHTSFLESLHSQDSVLYLSKKDDLLDTSGSGKVRNLKKEFEAKSADQTEPKPKVTSLPASPVSSHQPKASRDDGAASDDVNLKNLIGMFEGHRADAPATVTRRQKQNAARPFAQRNARHSCIEQATRIAQTPLISNLARNSCSEQEDKRPPMVPVVRNTSPRMVMATVITAARKKQHGKSHPLTWLNIKPRHNNPVYNTM